MELNEALIPHFRCAKIPIDDLKQRVNINSHYLKEKSTWYEVDGKLKYFKVRDDYRLFTEQFFCSFGSHIMDLDTLDYQVASIRAFDVTNQNSEERKLGLLSENFQKPGYNYYLISELLNSEISDLICYSGYSLSNLLAFFKQTLSNEDYERDKNFLIKLFISDAFALQSDRNHHNIGFEIPKIEGISYKQRLRPELLQQHQQALQFITVEEENVKLKGFLPTMVYDNEKILGIDHKNVMFYKPGMIWCPLFPYDNALLFETQEIADKTSKEQYDGLDPNLTELYMNYPNESRPYMERLAYDDEYRKILEGFSRKNSQIHLLSETQQYFEGVLEERKKEFQRVLEL